MVGIFSNKYEFKKNIHRSLFCNGRKIRYKRDTGSTKWSIWQALSLNFLMANVTWLLKRVTEKAMCCCILFWCFLSCVTDRSEDKPKVARKFELFSFRDLWLIICPLKATCVLVLTRENFAASRNVKMYASAQKMIGTIPWKHFLNMFHPRIFEMSPLNW